jgi:protoporphyrinogen oxidase
MEKSPIGSLVKDSSDRAKRVVIIGAGPAGLTVAWELSKAGVPAVVLEKDQVVGGLARTVNYRGYRFDIGGHRFFTKVRAVEEMWREVLAAGEFLHCERLSRIYYNRKFFYYPLRAANALLGLGLWNSTLILLSYLKARAFPVQPEETFEQWVTNRFGRRLYSIFFKTYTEKVWGIPCSEIRAEWAAQRIKGLSLLSAVKNALFAAHPANKDEIIKTLIDGFAYPKHGPGQMWETVAHLVTERGHEVRLETDVEKIIWRGDRIESVVISHHGQHNSNGHNSNGNGNHNGHDRHNRQRETMVGTHFVSSMPLGELVPKLDPPAPSAVQHAAARLSYRDFLTVALVINRRDLFPDNWIYVHDPDVKLGRIQNFKNWSRHMVPDESQTCLGLEYFCFEGDQLWTMTDAELIELGKRELEQLGLACAAEVVDGKVVRMPKAYPVYDGGYAEALDTVRQFLATFVNLQVVGRNGMHKYNNQDHSMLTAMLAARNILGARYDLWQVNAEQEYHEEVRAQDEVNEWAALAATQPRVPERLADVS